VSYRESLDYLYGLQRFGIKLGLENVRRLLARAGNPQDGMHLVHVAGTNGKGSVCSMLAALLMKAGHRTGLYTSPHLHAFNERIRVDGMPIDDGEIVTLTEQLRALCDGDIPATFFEFTTAMALCYFARQGVAWGVLETGMGGRLDATNAVMPQVSVITSISLDHAEHLGSDLEAIAAEKAGIIKPGVPLVTTVQPSEVLEVLRRCAEDKGAPVYRLGVDFHLEAKPDGSVDYRGVGAYCPGLHVPLAGRHQQENLALALAAFELCSASGGVSPETIREALDGVVWPGRLEWLPGEKPILLDGAHNLAGCQALADYLAAQSCSDILLIFGAKGDKASVEMLRVLLPFAEAVFLVEPPVESVAPLAPMEDLVRSAGIRVQRFDSVASALAAGEPGAYPGQTLVVAGSLFLVAAAREVLGLE